ncbi:MAG: anaerobic benzoate catabolism transcriptional regulator [Syntrophorhabdus sp. PtaU1.Bin050]|nr:MAG: anaerobic benzoate catabolism transcriptional regulator [Syntrophorhabdus sp. PtaU1.Bin050]
MENIGEKIRKERKAKGMSLTGLASRLGISPMTLQRIETGKKSPSVAVLAQISHQLMRPIDFFIKEDHPKILHIKKEQQSAVESSEMKLTVIAPQNLIDENILINLGEAKEGRFIGSHTEEGYSFVYMLEGECIFEHDRIKYHLKPDDALYYNARFPHSVAGKKGIQKFISVFFKGK